MKLLVGALQIAVIICGLPIGLVHEGDMGRGDIQPLAQLFQALKQGGFSNSGIFGVRDQQAGAGRRGKRHRALQLGVVLSSSPHESIGPAMVEHIFPLAVIFQITRQHTHQFAAGGFQEKMLRQPSGLSHSGLAGFQRVQKFVADKRVLRAGNQIIPGGRRNLFQRRHDAYVGLFFGHQIR